MYRYEVECPIMNDFYEDENERLQMMCFMMPDADHGRVVLAYHESFEEGRCRELVAYNNDRLQTT